MVPQTKWEKKRIKRLSKIMKSRHVASVAVDGVDGTGSTGGRVVGGGHWDSRDTDTDQFKRLADQEEGKVVMK